ncbi:hypothetical protein [uncultured Bacteroides sp.]|jgi:hypothetical protein|uniref:hypothetical protein n=1 Tax=uncultured Bacteroides sp. TaxID=162156 RepID=UPI0025FF9664|nr:hypothetical protein [uncultured Bacteroides sp.]
MELKDFIKGVVFDITNAIKECQNELENGAIISPTNTSANEKVKSKNGDLQISYIDFEVSVSASSEIGENGKKEGGGIQVSSSAFGFNIGGKTKGKTNEEEYKYVNENLSKIRFSIPIVYPTIKIKERSNHVHVSIPSLV